MIVYLYFKDKKNIENCEKNYCSCYIFVYFSKDLKCLENSQENQPITPRVCSIHRLYTTPHKAILGFADICSMEKFFLLYPRNEVVRGYTGFTMSVCLQTNPMSYDNLGCVSQNLLKFYQLYTGEERRIPFIFDDFHFCRSRVIGLDMTENRIFILCRMIT